MFKERDTHIGTLKVRGGGSDNNHPALFRRLSFLFNTVDFNPPGIPPSGILIVRQMTDPLPGQMAAQENAVRASPGWEQAVKHALAEKYRKAARPDGGYIPSNAEAVFFTDKSQMLAALALDINRREAWNRWWWKVILKNLEIPADTELGTLLNREITILPAVLYHLAEWRAVQKLVDTLTPDQTMTMLAALSKEYYLDKITAPVFHQKKIPAKNDSRVDVEPIKTKKKKDVPPGDLQKSKQPKDVVGTPKISTKAPWEREQWFPCYWVPSQMTRERAAMLGIALSLYQKPAKVRTTSFVRDFHQWWKYKQLASPGVPESVDLPTPSSASPEKQEIMAEKPIPLKPQPGESTSSSSSTPEPAAHSNYKPPGKMKPPAKKKKTDTTGMDALSHIRFEDENEAAQVSVSKKQAGNTDINLHFKNVSKNQVDQLLQREKPGIPEKIRFEDESKHQPEPLSHKKKTGTGEKSNEPVKKTAVLLPEEGVDTQLGGVFYLINLVEQMDLLTGFREKCSFESEIGPWGVLELLARALLGKINQPLATDPLWELLAQLEGRSDQIEKSKFSQWLDSILPDTRSYLRKVLGSPTQENPEPEKSMMLCPARVYVTATHVDIVMSLESISLPVRMAGLDRDPGWMPDFARVILFHYE